MWTPALVSLLAVFALTLSGCGGGGTDAPKMAPASLVSQSLTGTVTGEVTLDGKTTTVSGTMEADLDIDKLNLFVSQTGAGMVLNFAKKNLTIFANKTCMYVPLPGSPAITPKSIKMILERVINTGKPSMDGGNRKFDIGMPDAYKQEMKQMGVNIDGDASVELDGDNLMRKATSSEQVEPSQGPYKKMSSTSSFVATKATAGAPDPSHFEVPTSWGPCTPAKHPPSMLFTEAPLGSTAIAMALLHLLGDGQARPTAEVVV